MTDLLRGVITGVGADVADLLSGGILILFAEGAPPELAEVSVLHAVRDGVSADAPRPGAELRIGDVATVLTGVGPLAWAKVRDIGHVVVNFNGEATPQRPGELCAAPVDPARLLAALRPGAEIIVRS
jgi:PTS system glucitol/sorbitol-specific IIA component